MYQLEKTQLMIIMNNTSGTITNSRLSLIHQRKIQPGSDTEPSFSGSSAEYVSGKLVGNGDKPLSSIVNLLAMDLALWGLSKLLQHSLGYEGSWRLACKGKWQAYIDGGRGVGIPTIMGLALSSRKLPWEVENYFLYMEIWSQTSQLNLETSSGIGWSQYFTIYF